MNFNLLRHDNKVRSAKDLGKKFQSELAPSFSSIVYYDDRPEAL